MTWQSIEDLYLVIWNTFKALSRGTAPLAFRQAAGFTPAKLAPQSLRNLSAENEKRLVPVAVRITDRGDSKVTTEAGGRPIIPPGREVLANKRLGCGREWKGLSPHGASHFR